MKSFVFLFVIVLVFSFPFKTHGFLSFIVNQNANIKENKSIIAEEPPKNLQKMHLLESVSSPAISSINALGGGEITVDDFALVPENGPLGTPLDIAKISSSDRISLYVVRKEDSLSEIAKMFGVSVNTIIWANDLPRGKSISEGQVLLILPVSGVKYEIKKNDTLKSIAQKFKADLEEIEKFNGLTKESKLIVGQSIIIPDGELAVYQEPSNKSKNGKNIITNSGPEYIGYYLRPIVGGRKTQGIHSYNGVDLANSFGTPVFASAQGVVLVSKDSGWNSGYGKYIVIEHDNNTQTLYSHLSEILVSAGAIVNQGQTIGLVGSTGRSTGPHLHFEIRGARNPF